MSLQHAIDALTSERETLLAQVKVLTSEAAKLTEAISLIRGVTTSTPPIPSSAAPTPEAKNGHPPMAAEAVIHRVLEQRGDTHFDDVVQAVIAEGSETRPEVIEAALYGMVKGRKVDFMRGNRYVLASA
jgi:hypothetical protein